jgi:hypothetical protein
VIAQSIIDFTNPGSTKTCLLHQDTARDFLFSEEKDWAVQRKMWLELAGMGYLTPEKIKEAIKKWKRSPDYKKLDELVTKLKEASGRRSSTRGQRSHSSPSCGERAN